MTRFLTILLMIGALVGPCAAQEQPAAPAQPLLPHAVAVGDTGGTNEITVPENVVRFSGMITDLNSGVQSAQTFVLTPAAPVPVDPQYVLAFGLGFNHADSPQFKGELSFASRIADGTYSISSVNTTSKVSTITTGVSRRLFRAQGFTISALADGGVATGNGNVGGAFSGGGILTYDVSKVLKMPGTFVYGAVKVADAPIAGQISFTTVIGFGKGF